MNSLFLLPLARSGAEQGAHAGLVLLPHFSLESPSLK